MAHHAHNSKMDCRYPARTRCSLPEPRFWLVKVPTALARARNGIIRISEIRRAAVCATM